MFAMERDAREAAAIERRRMLEEERRARIFNPKTRTMGVDVAALDEQVRLKREAERAEAEREAAYAAEQERVRRELIRMEEEAEEARRTMLRGQQSFREQYQTFDSRKEFDLNDPQYIRKALPARVRCFFCPLPLSPPLLFPFSPRVTTPSHTTTPHTTPTLLTPQTPHTLTPPPPPPLSTPSPPLSPPHSHAFEIVRLFSLFLVSNFCGGVLFCSPSFAVVAIVT